MIKLKNVSKYYYKDGVIAAGFTKVNLELNLGEFVVITGESGSGKSTLLNVISGLDTYEDGEMYINGKETSHYTEEDYLLYRRKYVSNIFQNFNLVNSYTVYENIELAMLMNGKTHVKKDVLAIIDKIGLKKYRHTVVSKLSGGQKQRVAIGRALANDTPIIVADEPTGSLDSKSSSAILKLLHDISAEKLVIVVTHNKKEIEQYATRLIKMNDGKILENRLITPINLDNKIKENKIKDITLKNKIRLSIRNAFNIPIKFILMLAIYLLITITLIINYSSIKMAEYEELNYAYNNYFTNTDNLRIIIKKSDDRQILSDDFQKIEQISHIASITKNDFLTDINLNIHNDNIYLDGLIAKEKIVQVDKGRLPTNDNEIVILGHPDNWYLSELESDILAQNFRNDEMNIDNIKVVGIVYTYDNLYNVRFVLANNLEEIFLNYAKTIYNDTKIKLDKTTLYTDFSIIPTSLINKGEVVIGDSLRGYCPNLNCINNIIQINTSNIYEERESKLTIKNILTKENAQQLLNIEYGNYYNPIFINTSDYNELLGNDIYQSSIYVDEIKNLDEVNKNLEDLGYETLVMRKSLFNEAETVKQITNILKLIISIILIITLFFISYFIMKIIYKARNSYYTTIRTLGGTKKNCVSILMGELLFLASFTYLLFVIFTSLVNKDIISYPYLKNIIHYINIADYLLVYLILLLLSILMAYRYGRKIFQKSIIKTYGERL